MVLLVVIIFTACTIGTIEQAETELQEVKARQEREVSMKQPHAYSYRIFIGAHFHEGASDTYGISQYLEETRTYHTAWTPLLRAAGHVKVMVF